MRAVHRIACLLAVTAFAVSALAAQPQSLIPEFWSDELLHDYELPLATPSATPKHVSRDYYYALPERVLYKSYPIYHPSREPAGYLDRLRRAEPERAFDAAQLKTGPDWVRAGRDVFEMPIDYGGPIVSLEAVRDPGWYERHRVPLTASGIMPFARYVVRERGRVEVGNLACAMCHTRVMPDGTAIHGAQGNFPFDPAATEQIAPAPPAVANFVRDVLSAAPWDPSVTARLDAMTPHDTVQAMLMTPPGVLARQGTSLLAPPAVPDLIGLRDRKYFDKTGLGRHRGIADVMRYAAMNQTMDALASYDGYVPAAGDRKTLPPPGKAGFSGARDRYSDPQLYALAQFIYALTPPQNPNRFDATAKRGQQVFNASGCARCHTPPLYTANKLVPADGFTPPSEHYEKYDILDARVGTDPTLTMKTRRGTGYYKIPSLKGVWYRGPFEHNGSVATLEDWFNPARLQDDYIPTGWVGYGQKTRAVKGHPFGLQLSAADRAALIAFLKTL